MASVDQPFQTENQQQNQQPGGQSTANSSVGQPAQLVSGSGNVGGGAGSMGSSGQSGSPNTSGQPQNPTGTSSGAYPNLSKYMQANAGWNSANGGLGGEIATNLNQQGNQVQQSINQANQGFQNQGNAWQQNLGQANQGFQQGLTNPYAYLQGQGNQQQANQVLNAQYTGPTNLAQTSPNLQQQVQNYTQEAQQGQTQAGQINLLQQMFGNSNYTQGQQSLDQALIQNSPWQMSALQGAQQQANQANSQYNTAQQAAQNAAQAWQNYAQQTQQGGISALNTGINNLNTNVQNEYQNTLNAQQGALNAAQQGFTSGNIPQNIANELQLGVPGNEVIYNVNPADYLSSVALTPQNTATAQDYQNIAAMSALGQLAPNAITGTNQQFLQQYTTSPGQLYNSSNDIAFNTSGFQNAVQQAAQAYQNAIAGDVGTINSLGINPLNPGGTGGNFIANPTTNTGTTFAQLGTPNFANVNIPTITGQGANVSPLTYYTSQYNVPMVYNTNPTTGQSTVNTAQTLANLYANQNFLQNASPLQWMETVASGGPTSYNEGLFNSLAGGTQTAPLIGALQGLINANQTYDPTRTLNIT